MVAPPAQFCRQRLPQQVWLLRQHRVVVLLVVQKLQVYPERQVQVCAPASLALPRANMPPTAVTIAALTAARREMGAASFLVSSSNRCSSMKRYSLLRMPGAILAPASSTPATSMSPDEG